MIKRTYLSFSYILLYFPLFILIIFSFINKGHFSLHWYYILTQDENILNVTCNSLMLAITGATFATTLGTLAAVVLLRYRFPGKRLFNATLFSYIILPDLVIGISLLLLMHILKIQLGLITLLIGHITLCLPFVVITINSRLYDLDQHLFESAKDLGANEITLFFRIILPLLMPAIFAAWLLCFTLSMDDVIISYFLTGPSFQVLPLYIYSLVRIGITPEINAICSIIFSATLVLILCAQLGLRKR